MPEEKKLCDICGKPRTQGHHHAGHNKAKPAVTDSGLPKSAPTKTCSKCGCELPAKTEFFHVAKTGQFGLNSVCKECRSKKAKTSARANKTSSGNGRRKPITKTQPAKLPAGDVTPEDLFRAVRKQIAGDLLKEFTAFIQERFV